MVCYSQPSGGINLGILLGKKKKGRHFKRILRNKKKILCKNTWSDCLLAYDKQITTTKW